MRCTAIALSIMMISIVGASLLPAPQVAADSSFTFSAAGDYGSWGGFSATMRLLNNSRSEIGFNLALGDLSYGGNTGYANTTEEAWCEKFHRYFPSLELIAGNHDTGQQSLLEGNINNFTKYCPFTLQTPIGGTYGKQYYFDYPAANPLARFILISPDIVYVVDGGEHYDYRVNSPRYNWTAQAIDSARAAGIPWVIVGMHKNCIAAGEHACEIGTDIFNLLLQKNVPLILQAHTHNYERSKQLTIGGTCDGIQLHLYNPACVVNDGTTRQYAASAGSVLVISGTGGRELDAFNASDPYSNYFAANGWMANNTPGLENSASQAGLGNGVVVFNVSASQISMYTKFNTTAYSDSFTLTRATGTPLFETLIEYAPIFILGGIGVAAVVVWRRRKRAGKKSRDFEL